MIAPCWNRCSRNGGQGRGAALARYAALRRNPDWALRAAWGRGASGRHPHAERGDEPMAAYSPEKLLHLWKQETLTAEQAIGQLLQQVAALEQRLRTIEQPRSN